MLDNFSGNLESETAHSRDTQQVPEPAQDSGQTDTAGTQVTGGPGCQRSVALDSYTNDAKQFSMKIPLLNALTHQISKTQCKRAA